MLGSDPSVVLMGEDIGYFGGVFRTTEGLQRKYGEHRVLDTPIAEGGIVAAAIGMGVNGLRPVAEIQFADYIYPGFDQIVSEFARLRYRTAGEFFAPVTIRTPCGGGIRGGQTHSQSPEGIFTHVSGLKVVMPSNPYDAKGLLITSIEDDDPVVFFEPKRLYNGPFDGDPTQARGAVEHPSEGPGGRGVLHGAAGVGRCGAQRLAVHHHHLRHHGVRRAGRGREPRSGCRDHRFALAGAARRRHHLPLGEEDRPLRGGARGDAIFRFRRRDLIGGPGGMLLGLGGADPARRRLGYALSACLRMGVFPGTGARRHGHQGRDGAVMSQYVFKMPDLGEGTVEAEIVAWHTQPGAVVAEDQIIVEVMTDKAAVEVPAPVSGRVVSITGVPGDKVAVGSPLIVFETDAAGAGADAGARRRRGRRRGGESRPAPAAGRPRGGTRCGAPRLRSGRIMASPANRRRAREAGIDLTSIAGSGPGGRICATI